MQNTSKNKNTVDCFRFKKTVILFLAVCLFCVVAPYRAEATCDIDPDGTYIEAENYTQLVDGHPDQTFSVESSQAGYNGTGYLLSVGTSDYGDPPQGQRADYTVNFTETGLYYVWIREYATDTGDDSVSFGFDGTKVASWHLGGVYNQWFWNNAGAQTINVTSTGEHTLNLWMREYNHLTDGIYITKDSGGIPGGTSVGIPTAAALINPSDCSCSSESFSKYRTVTFDHTKVMADLTDFPVMVMLTGSEFQEIENDVTDTEGDDIIFRGTMYGNPLSHEIEVYDTSNDLLVAWVKIPSLSSSSPSTTIYMWYGKSCITTPTENPSGVWNSCYKMVQHLQEGPSGSPPQVLDSTSNSNDGTVASTTTVEVRVSTSTDDAEENISTGAIDLTSSD